MGSKKGGRGRPGKKRMMPGAGKKLKTESSAAASAGEKLRTEKSAQSAAGDKLRFEKAVFIPGEGISKGKKLVRDRQYEAKKFGRKPPAAKPSAVKRAGSAASGKLHDEISKENEDGNVSVEAANRGTQAAETVAGKGSNALSRFFQKRAIKQEYAAAKAGKSAGTAAGNAAGKALGGLGTSAGKTAASLRTPGGAAVKGASSAANVAGSLVSRLQDFVVSHAHVLVGAGGFFLLIVMVSGMMTSCSALFQGVANGVVGSSYTEEDPAITEVEKTYLGLEGALKSNLASPKEAWPGYDGYQVHADAITHNPYELAAYIQVLRLSGYSDDRIKEIVKDLFKKQYTITFKVETIASLRTTRDILHITVANNNLSTIIANSGMTADQKKHYAVLMETYGNHPEIFTDEFYSTGMAETLQYQVPGEALSDERFARMVAEAEKHLGTPYVWGGSSPGGFDCSGFVSYVINHCGNGWDYGRLTAEGWRQQCRTIPKSEAKPGDLIFFQGTYNTSGASHVGIYVGDGKMIHCGHPVQYASTETSYWKNHFMCIGRLP